MLPPHQIFNKTCQMKKNLLYISFSSTGVHFTSATSVSAHDFAPGGATPFTLVMLLLASPLISVGSKRIEQTLSKKILAYISNKSIARVPTVNIIYQESIIRGFKSSEHQGVLLGDWFPTILKFEMPSSSRFDLDVEGTTTCGGVGDHSPNDTV